MNAKSILFLVVGCGMMAIVLYGLMILFGVALVGPELGKAVFFLAVGFAGIAIWEFVGSVINVKR